MSEQDDYYGIDNKGFRLPEPMPYPIIDIVRRMIENGAFGGGGPGVTDHGVLSGLGDDDHPQYHNDARGDARYALISHTQDISSITGLQTVLDNKVDDSQISTFSYTLLDNADAAAWRTGLELGSIATHDASEFALAVHTHSIAQVSGLQAALDGKAATSHTHVAADITDFTAAVTALIPPGSDYNADETSLTEASNTFSIKALGVATGHLQAASVTYAKIQNVNNDQVLGRFAGSAGTVQEIAFTAGARAFSQLPDLASQKTYLGIANITEGDYKESVLVATTGNVTLSGEQTIDGVLTAASRVLVWQQTTGAQNGIYLTGAGAWTRTTDADVDAEVTSGLMVPVDQGTAYSDQLFQLVTPDPIVLGTTALSFQSISAPPGFIAYKTVTGTTYTNILSDANRRLLFTNAGTKTMTVAPQSSVAMAQNTVIELWNAGAGALTVAPGSSVTINALSLTIPENGCGQLKKRANPNTWDLFVIKTGGLTNWTEGVSTSAPNTTVPAVYLVVNNAASGVDAVISPKGTTGSIMAQVPDNTATGGNKRGGRAVDWQQHRVGATQVASGFASMILGGANCTASQNYSIAGGYGALASGGEGAIALGGVNSIGSPTASAQGAVAIGYGATASGQYSLGLGVGVASGYGSFAFGAGDTFAAAGTSTTNLNARSTVLTGAYSFAIGGKDGNARGIVAAQVQGIPGGSEQWLRLLIARATTNATPTELTTDRSAATSTNQLVLANGCAYLVTGKVLAYDVTYSGGPQGGPMKSWEFKLHIHRRGIASTIAIQGTPQISVIQQDMAAAAWDLTFSADTTNSLLKILGTGAASKTINWLGDIDVLSIQDFNT